MPANHNHVTLATDSLASAEDARDHLIEMGDDHANTYEARQLRADIGFYLKVAEVHALLAIAATAPDLGGPLTVRLNGAQL